MEMKFLKRVMAFLLCVALLTGIVPVTAWAEGNVAERGETGAELPESITVTWENPLYTHDREEIVWPEAPAVSLAEDLTYHKDPASAAAEIREKVIARDGTIVFGYEIPVNNYTNAGVKELHLEILDQIFAHTGVSDEGDYLRWSYDRSSLNPVAVAWSQDGTGYVCNVTLNMFYLDSAWHEAAVEDAAAELLTALAPAGTDYEKIKTVYDWMCENITYDYTSATLLKHTAYAALVDRTAVCQGYALLLYRLALEMGIDCRIITGKGNGGDHGWNIVELDGYYYDLDATWDAACKQAGLDYKYFLTTDENFGDHQRAADYASGSFYAAYPMGAADYKPGSAAVASGTCGDDLTWKLDSKGTLTISGTGEMYNYSGVTNMFEDEEINPAPWNGESEKILRIVIEEGVASIGEDAFPFCCNLTEVTIPDSVGSIGEDAFVCCEGLTEVVIPGSVSAIGDYAFKRCENLASVTIEDGVVSIGYEAFAFCNNLTSITIPDSVTNLDDCVFEDCSNLAELVIGDGVTTITDYTLCCLSGMTSITIGSGVTAINEDAFHDCGSLMRIVVDENNPNYASDDAGALFNKDKTKLVRVPNAWSGTYTVPKGVTAIGAHAVSGCKKLVSVVISDGVTEIGEYAFSACYDLTNVEIPDSVTSIGAYAFMFAGITEVEIPENVTDIGDGVFRWCENLTSVRFSGNAPVFNSGTFSTLATTCYYPAGNPTWTEDVLQNYDGNITWIPFDGPGIEAPELKASNVASTGKIKLSWNAVEGAAKYEIWRATTKDGEYTRLSTTTKTSATNTKVEAGKTYYYKVCAVDANGNKSGWSDVVYRMCDLPQPKVTLSNVASTGKIKLSWE